MRRTDRSGIAASSAVGRKAAGWIPNPWIAGEVALAAGSAILVIPGSWNWSAVAAILAIDVGMIVAVLLLVAAIGMGNAP